MTETSSPKVVPALTKTDAKELKALVRRDNEILMGELTRRHDDFFALINKDKVERLDVVNEERQSRDEADTKAANAALAKLQKRVQSLNEAIVETLTELSEDGWAYSRRTRGYGVTGERQPVNPHAHAVSIPYLDQLTPPGRDDSDLDEQEAEIKEETRKALDAVASQYNEAKRTLETQEADMLRDLTLQSITTEAAREFILEMPTAAELLPPPEGVEALEAGDE